MQRRRGELHMNREVYRYVFVDSVLLEDVEATLNLALLGVQSLHGESRVRLDARYVFDAEKRAFVIDASTAVGESLNQLFIGYVRQEFGEDAFRVERVDRLPAPKSSGASV
jgi:hypothetical protein